MNLETNKNEGEDMFLPDIDRNENCTGLSGHKLCSQVLCLSMVQQNM